MFVKATGCYLKMSIDKKIIKERLSDLVNSKSQDDNKINELVNKAEILKKRLCIEVEHQDD